MKHRTYLIFGPPGAGKATHAHTLGSVPRFYHISRADVFRSLETRTPVGQAYLEHASRGAFVPDEVTVELWLARIDAEVNAHTFKPDLDALVLDAIPQNVNQARLLEEHFDVAMVFFLDVPDRVTLAARVRDRALHENRFDDANEAAIQRRLAAFDAESRPLLEYYPRDIIRRVDATNSAAVVMHDLLREIVAAGESSDYVQLRHLEEVR
ncbi:adenylate kinase [soil metagenome]